MVEQNEDDKLCQIFEDLTITKNKGVGAGGKNTNLNGKKFEDVTDCQKIISDFNKVIINKSKFGYYLSKSVKLNESETTYTFVLQSGLKLYFKTQYNIDLFRYPDEAFIIVNDRVIELYIIEKKEQKVEGSVETKLWSSPSLKREYEITLETLKDFEVKVHYILCLSNFFKDKFENNLKYKTLKRILDENNIKVLYGKDENYFEDLKNIIKF